MAMRVAQYRLPGEGAEDASLVVFRFAGNGTIQQNFARWVGQFQQPDGRSSVEVAKTRQFYAGGLPIYVLDVTGIFVAETRPGSGVRENKQDWRMIGAVAEASDELVFVKATGPDATLERWSASIDAFLHRLVE